jgi:exodeoxyribonuclease VII large subunit
MQQRLALSIKHNLGQSLQQLSELTLKLSRYHPQRLWQDYQQRFDMADMALKNIRHFIREPQIALHNAQQRLFNSADARLKGKIDRGQDNLNNLAGQLRVLGHNILAQHTMELKAKAGLLAQLSPDNMLQKGWALAMKDNHLVRSIRELNTGDVLKLQLSDGSTQVEVNKDK